VGSLSALSPHNAGVKGSSPSLFSMIFQRDFPFPAGQEIPRFFPTCRRRSRAGSYAAADHGRILCLGPAAYASGSDQGQNRIAANYLRSRLSAVRDCNGCTMVLRSIVRVGRSFYPSTHTIPVPCRLAAGRTGSQRVPLCIEQAGCLLPTYLQSDLGEMAWLPSPVAAVPE
jgi:hypothetical protein